MYTTLDLSPLMRSFVGIDNLLRSVEAASRVATQGYPPYNLEQIGDDRFRVTLAVAGFTPDEIEVTAERGKLTITGKPVEVEGDNAPKFLYRGIGRRSFVRTFFLGEHIDVEGASFSNGLLYIDLRREVPEEQRPRKIDIAAK